MSRERTKTKVLDPRVFQDNRIDPMEIYGFADFVKGRTKSIVDHSEFPNPRSIKNMDQGIIEDVKSAGSILEPVKLFWNADGAIILADGKTRLTGLGEHLQAHPELIGKLLIPLQRLRGTANEIKLLMLKYGLEDTRSPLVPGDVAKFLRNLDDQGVTQEEQLRMLDKGGRRGVMWLNRIKTVINANPTVVEAFEDGRLDLATAKHIGKMPFAEQKAAVETFLAVKAKHPEVPEAKLRQIAGVKKANKVTMGYDSCMEYLIVNSYPAYDYALYLRKARGKTWLKNLDWSNEADRTQYLEAEQAGLRWECYSWFLKLTGMSNEEQRAVVEESMTHAQKEMLDEARATYGMRSVANILVSSSAHDLSAE